MIFCFIIRNMNDCDCGASRLSDYQPALVAPPQSSPPAFHSPPWAASVGGAGAADQSSTCAGGAAPSTTGSASAFGTPSAAQSPEVSSPSPVQSGACGAASIGSISFACYSVQQFLHLSQSPPC